MSVNNLNRISLDLKHHRMIGLHVKKWTWTFLGSKVKVTMTYHEGFFDLHLQTISLSTFPILFSRYGIAGRDRCTCFLVTKTFSFRTILQLDEIWNQLFLHNYRNHVKCLDKNVETRLHSKCSWIVMWFTKFMHLF